VKNWVDELLLGGATLCYKFDEHTVNRCIQHPTMLNLPKIIQIGSCVLKMLAVKLVGFIFLPPFISNSSSSICIGDGLISL